MSFLGDYGVSFGLDSYRGDYHVDNSFPYSTPLALGALEWWRSTNGVTAPSDKASDWMGTINGIVASQAVLANRMDYVANSVNLGGPALVVRDASDFIEAAFAGGELDNGLTLFVFGYVPAGLSAAFIFGSRDPATGNNGRAYCVWQAAATTTAFGAAVIDDGGFVQTITDQHFSAQKGWWLLSYQPDGTLRARTHTVTVSGVMPAGAITPTRIFAGSPFGNAPVDFEYGQVILFDRQLSLADENTMAAYGATLL